jgi:uncharacterized protein YndB with AHSA1/START domain
LSQHIEISRIFDAPRELVYRAFTDPDQIGQWFGPTGFSVPRDSVEMDVRVGGHMRFLMVGPGLRSPIDMTFAEVVENELLAGEMAAGGGPGATGSQSMHLRLEFHDEGNGKTRLELRQGPFPADQFGAGARSGWDQAFAKLDALL